MARRNHNKREPGHKLKGTFEVIARDKNFDLIYENKTTLQIKDLSRVFRDLRNKGIPIDEAVERSIVLTQEDWW